ncbi:MAG TPA: phosphodiester glycosidase family protein [Syntrophomonadaceae bacterium]|nr:phosphodiester glycosidase family protein [Syntrophomonadaceae bacterium]
MKKVSVLCIRFIISSALIFVLTFPLIVLYGPFTNIRSTVIGAVATSMHSYWLYYFMSDAQVDKLLAEAQGNSSTNNNQVLSDFENSHSGNIILTNITSTRFQGYLLEISDPTRLKVGVAQTLGQAGQTISEIAKQSGAIACVNGGGFIDPEGSGNGGVPFGVIVKNGSIIYGGNSRASVPLIGLNKQGALVIGNYTPDQIRAMQIAEGISFYPTLIMNGQKQIDSGDGGWGIAPRTAIGQKADGHILLLVIDGRQPQYSLGATLVDVQNILYDNGAITAANLDGGSSTTMYYQGKVINRPCSANGGRSIPTAFVVE